MGVEGNKTADQLATAGSAHTLTGPGSAYEISQRVAKWAISDRMYRDHHKYLDKNM
jgi:hypothetical protein